MNEKYLEKECKGILIVNEGDDSLTIVINSDVSVDKETLSSVREEFKRASEQTLNTGNFAALRTHCVE